MNPATSCSSPPTQLITWWNSTNCPIKSWTNKQHNVHISIAKMRIFMEILILNYSYGMKKCVGWYHKYPIIYPMIYNYVYVYIYISAQNNSTILLLQSSNTLPYPHESSLTRLKSHEIPFQSHWFPPIDHLIEMNHHVLTISSPWKSI